MLVVAFPYPLKMFPHIIKEQVFLTFYKYGQKYQLSVVKLGELMVHHLCVYLEMKCIYKYLGCAYEGKQML